MKTKKIIKRKFEIDHDGFYILPLFGYSNTNGNKSFWVGWGPWLWTWALNYSFDVSDI